MVRKTNSDWLQEKLKQLADLTLTVTQEEPTTNYKAHTVLKLIGLNYYAKTFTNIVQNQITKGWYDAAVYVDLFAGTGLVKLKGTKFDDYMPGSPLCASSNRFDYLVCVDSVMDKCRILEERLQNSSKEFDVICGDCNQKISTVVELIKKKYERPIILAFVDPEGLAIKFSTLKTLNNAFLSCDFMVNVNSPGVRRVTGKIQKGIDDVRSNLEGYYDDEDANKILGEFAAGTTPEEKYERLIRESLGKPRGSTISIKDTKEKVAYHILCFTRQTRGNSPYSKTLNELKKRLDWTNGAIVSRCLETTYSRQNTLDYN